MTRDRDFTGKVALATGAGTGIGKATALLLAGRGAKVTLVGSAALEWAPRGVPINELQPGVIDTPMTAQGGEEENGQIASLIAARRTGQPREVASAIAFLLSDEASYVMGAHLAVDGGFRA